MRNRILGILGFTVALAMLPTAGEAAPLDCPQTIGGNTGFNRQYWVDPATACVWGTGKVNNGGEDFFLDGSEITGGINLPAILGASTSGSAAGWTNVSYDFDNSSNTDPNWTIPNYDATKQYLVGIKDGQNPTWALFLVSAASGTWGTLPLDAWSHGVLYSRAGLTPNPLTPVPEPTSLALLGFGLAIAGRHLRNRRLQARR